MALQIKIHGETPKSGKSICGTCKLGTRVVGQNCQEIMFCAGPFSGEGSKGPVPFKISECADYHPSNMPYLHEMKEIAWKIEARKRGPAGFGEAVTQTEMEIVVTPPTKQYGYGSPVSDD